MNRLLDVNKWSLVYYWALEAVLEAVPYSENWMNAGQTDTTITLLFGHLVNILGYFLCKTKYYVVKRHMNISIRDIILNALNIYMIKLEFKIS